ncbi:MAG: polynucleotide kinase-phosphatase [Planctomycetota bacterium]|nr:polynucleotide kinase-phosphatase [Planctomycetota bacterium]
MRIEIPKLSLVVLIGPSGAGKSTFARKHFLPTEVISSDYCRGLVSDDQNNQAASSDAFEVLNLIAEKRLARGRLTVIDATNVQKTARAPFVQIARKYHCLPVAIVLNLPENVCVERNATRPDRTFGVHVVRRQKTDLRQSLRRLKLEGFRKVYVLDTLEDVEAVTIERVPLWNDRTDERGPFDIIGDLHGCATELEELLGKLGYVAERVENPEPLWGDTYYRHPAGRKAIFVGDLVDRGPRVLDVVRIVRNMTLHQTGLSVAGNHDMKLLKKLSGRDVQVTHGLAESLAEIEAIDSEQRDRFSQILANYLEGLISHYVFDGGRLVVAHAGLKESMHGRGSGRVRDFALYGETTGETDEFGLPVRLNWAADYRGAATVVYGHTPVPEPEWLNNTVDIDTGCVFGGRLTALRYPEREFVSVPARQTWCEPKRPLRVPEPEPPALSAQQQVDDILDAGDVLGKRIITTRLSRNIIIREENATAALEVMSRFAANPKWLIYLPPTMSPSETTSEPGLLEHPAEAFAYYRNQGVPRVVCEEKHMGSRAVVVVCRDAESARSRFGVIEGEAGIVYTRTGRRFFNDAGLEREFLDRLRTALEQANVWEDFQTTWVCLDCELMPWSAKAQELLRHQYAAVGAAGSAAIPQVVSLLEQAVGRAAGEARDKIDQLTAAHRTRLDNVRSFVAAYRHYCWPVNSLNDFKLAPFHLLATEGQVHTHQTHVWHMETLARVCAADPQLLLATPHREIDVTDPASEQAGIAWWCELVERGGEGMVVKPLEFIAHGPKGVVQPAVKCRGPEYLRIIYGPDYTNPEHLSRLRSRGVGGKRSLAMREFALGIESLERFTRKEPLRRVHECVFGVLALESEPIDPRL